MTADPVPVPVAAPAAASCDDGPATLGDPGFRRDRNTRPELVVGLGRAGLLGHLGPGGLSRERAAEDLRRARWLRLEHRPGYRSPVGRR
ncbi:hypothetical protein ABT093_02505 [Kitasatospora sp. NPDC002551]|uniref:hypothetical protein n=1 Tax=Kitasatospora sp. NPDC002551 TaxID=3154539 RepID=UPI00331FB741